MFIHTYIQTYVYAGVHRGVLYETNKPMSTAPPHSECRRVTRVLRVRTYRQAVPSRMELVSSATRRPCETASQTTRRLYAETREKETREKNAGAEAKPGKEKKFEVINDSAKVETKGERCSSRPVVVRRELLVFELHVECQTGDWSVHTPRG